MAAGSTKRMPKNENQYLFEFGKVGRKTGLTLPDTGIRDEYGMEPVEGLFSSPEKQQFSSRGKSSSIPSKSSTSQNFRAANRTMSDEVDMEESSIPDPTTVLSARRKSSIRKPIPRSSSPKKTFIAQQSPARRHPSLGPATSPTRGDVVSPTRALSHTYGNRRLDFSTTDLYPPSAAKPSPPKRSRVPDASNIDPRLIDGTGDSLSPQALRVAPVTDENKVEEVPEVDESGGKADEYADDDDYQPGQYGEDDHDSELIETQLMETQPIPEVQERQDDYEERGDSPAMEEDPQLPSSPSTAAARIVKKSSAKRRVEKSRGKKRSSQESREAEEEEEEEEEQQLPIRASKKQRGLAEPSEAELNVPKKRGKPAAKKVLDTAKSVALPPATSSPPQVKYAPPLPRKSRGLHILRRETPNDANFQTTRSGRHTIKPVQYWKNEAVVYEDEEDPDASFVMPRLKEVIRADEISPPKRSRSAPKSRKHGRKPRPSESEEEPEDDVESETEPWELEPGQIFGEVRDWDPEDQICISTAEKTDQIALSDAAMVTRDIPGASFKFAKTLSLPFFGSGMVDLPPGSVKKPKNSRRMQMVFFVFYGRVQVTVNDTTFRISKGGMWQVPRGNFYSIENDYDQPARIFFSQGCEVTAEAGDD